MPKSIKIVNIGQYIGAVKSGRCPMYAVTDKNNKKDLIEGLKEDFPDYIIEDGTKLDRAALAKFIIRTTTGRN